MVSFQKLGGIDSSAAGSGGVGRLQALQTGIANQLQQKARLQGVLGDLAQTGLAVGGRIGQDVLERKAKREALADQQALEQQQSEALAGFLDLSLPGTGNQVSDINGSTFEVGASFNQQPTLSDLASTGVDSTTLLKAADLSGRTPTGRKKLVEAQEAEKEFDILQIQDQTGKSRRQVMADLDRDKIISQIQKNQSQIELNNKKSQNKINSLSTEEQKMLGKTSAGINQLFTLTDSLTDIFESSPIGGRGRSARAILSEFGDRGAAQIAAFRNFLPLAAPAIRGGLTGEKKFSDADVTQTIPALPTEDSSMVEAEESVRLLAKAYLAANADLLGRAGRTQELKELERLAAGKNIFKRTSAKVLPTSSSRSNQQNDNFDSISLDDIDAAIQRKTGGR